MESGHDCCVATLARGSRYCDHYRRYSSELLDHAPCPLETTGEKDSFQSCLRGVVICPDNGTPVWPSSMPSPGDCQRTSTEWDLRALFIYIPRRDYHDDNDDGNDGSVGRLGPSRARAGKLTSLFALSVHHNTMWVTEISSSVPAKHCPEALLIGPLRALLIGRPASPHASSRLPVFPPRRRCLRLKFGQGQTRADK